MIDIHKVITGNPITKNLMKPWGSKKQKRFLISTLDQETTFQSK